MNMLFSFEITFMRATGGFRSFLAPQDLVGAIKGSTFMLKKVFKSIKKQTCKYMITNHLSQSTKKGQQILIIYHLIAITMKQIKGTFVLF